MQKTKAIILAGGSGSRLYPLTSIMSKQLQPVYDKPMIYYPLATLMLAGIQDILIITTPHDAPHFHQLLGDGTKWGITISYAEQSAPRGIAEAFLYGKEFIGTDQVCLILGDNLFYGKLDFLRQAIAHNKGATIFGYPDQDPEGYGDVEFNADGSIISIEEKPSKPKSQYAIPGLYVFDNEVISIAEQLQPSPRGELEITDVQKIYLQKQRLKVEKMGRGIAWLDTGTPESLLEAGEFIHAIEKRQNLKIACLEEIALRMNFIDIDSYQSLLETLPNSSYREYCKRVLQEHLAS